MAPWTFPQRLQNELDFAGRSGFLKAALVVHWLPCALSTAPERESGREPRGG